MSVWALYAASAVATLAIGTTGAFGDVQPTRRLLAVSIAYSGLFLVFVAMARRAPSELADPVPHALVLTGIVVSVSATAVALSLARRLVRAMAIDARSKRGSSSGESGPPVAGDP